MNQTPEQKIAQLRQTALDSNGTFSETPEGFESSIPFPKFKATIHYQYNKNGELTNQYIDNPPSVVLPSFK